MQFVQISSAPDKIPNWLPPVGRWKQQDPIIWLKRYSWRLLTFQSVPCVHSCTPSASALGEISPRADPTQSGECEVGKVPAPGHCHLPRHILILRPWPGGEAPPWPLYLFPLSPSIVCTEGVGTLLLFCHIPSPSYPGNVGTLWSHPRPGLGMLRKIMLIRNIGLLHLQGQASRLRRVLPFSAR